VIKGEGTSNVKTPATVEGVVLPEWLVSLAGSALVGVVGGGRDTTLEGNCCEVAVPTGDSKGWHSPSHSGHWGVFRGGICREYVLTRLNIPTLIQLRKLPDYPMKSSMEYVLYIYRIMYDIQIDFPPGIII